MYLLDSRDLVSIEIFNFIVPHIYHTGEGDIFNFCGVFPGVILSHSKFLWKFMRGTIIEI